MLHPHRPTKGVLPTSIRPVLVWGLSQPVLTHARARSQQAPCRELATPHPPRAFPHEWGRGPRRVVESGEACGRFRAHRQRPALCPHFRSWLTKHKSRKADCTIAVLYQSARKSHEKRRIISKQANATPRYRRRRRRRHDATQRRHGANPIHSRAPFVPVHEELEKAVLNLL